MAAFDRAIDDRWPPESHESAAHRPGEPDATRPLRMQAAAGCRIQLRLRQHRASLWRLTLREPALWRESLRSALIAGLFYSLVWLGLVAARVPTDVMLTLAIGVPLTTFVTVYLTLARLHVHDRLARTSWQRN